MDRREFSGATALALGSAALGLPHAARAQRRPEEGKHYRALDRRAPVQAPPDKIEVVEFFWYSCPHCNQFEPRLNAWLKSRQPADVSFRRVPVAFRADFVPQQRLYYTLEALGKVEELHGKVFHEIHANRQPTHREDLIFAFAEKNGLDRARFQEVFHSAPVNTRARQATELQDAYEVAGVPALGVAGRYYTDADMAGTLDNALQVVEYLVAEVRRSR